MAHETHEDTTIGKCSVPSTGKPLLILTDIAAEMLGQFAARRPPGDDIIRISVNPAAPIEGKYELEFVTTRDIPQGDATFTMSGLRFAIPAGSIDGLQGTTIDYVRGMWSSGFRFENPNRLALMSDPIAPSVLRVIEERVNPLVASHGGRIELVDVRHGTVYLQMQGGCQGCGKAPDTMRHAIDSILKTAFPDGVLEIVDTTDHASGKTPYYR